MQGIAFGPTIRLLRQAKGISLREMARQLGVSPAFLSQIEAGRQHKIPKARIVQVADMLGVSEGYLLGTAKQIHPEVIRFLSETPEAAEFMTTAIKQGMNAEDFTHLSGMLQNGGIRAGLKKIKLPAAKKKKSGKTDHELEEFLDSSLCLTGVSVQNKERMFTRFAKLVQKKHKDVPADMLVERLEQRESKSPTSVGGGVAIPHAFLPQMDAPAIGVFLLKRALPYGPTPADKVRTVFFLVGKENEPQHHLPILARIARLCSTPEFLEVLAKSNSGRDMFKTIVNWDKRITS